MNLNERLKYFLILAGSVVVYFVIGQLGLRFDAYHGFVTMVWPAAGFALALLLVLGKKYWPAIYAGAVLVNWFSGAPFVVAAMIAVGNTLEALLGSALLKRFAFDKRLSRIRDVVLLLTLAAAFSSCLAASVGVMSLKFGNIITFEQMSYAWFTWWFGDAMGILIFAPVLFAWSRKDEERPFRPTTEKWAFAILLFLMSFWIFGPYYGVLIEDFPRPYLLFPFVFWSASRFGQRGTVLATLFIAIVAILGTSYGYGPFEGQLLSQKLFQLEVFLGVMVFTALSLSAMFSQWIETELSLQMRYQVLEHMTEGVSITDESGFIIYTNPAEDRIFGYERGELIGQNVTVLNIYAPEENARRVAEVIEDLKNRSAWFGEFENKKKDGTRFTTFAKITLLNTGYRKYFVCVQEDITERKKIWKTLEESNSQVRLITDAIPALISYIGRDLKYQFVNTQYEKWFGRPPKDFVGKPMTEVLGAEAVSTIKEHVDAVLSGKKVTYETMIPFNSGTRHVTGDYVPDIDEAGNVRGFVVLARDTTEEKRNREELAKAIQSRDQFLATLSHELRTPLNVILGWVQMLRSTKMDEKTFRQALETLDRNVQMQKQLIDDLLDVSRIITGKLSMELRPLSLNAVVKETVNGFTPRAKSKNITLTCELDGPLPVSGDETRIAQVVSNLLVNALKFTPVGGTINVRVVRLDGFAKLTVRDNGQGIDPVFLPHVFEALRQENMETTRMHGGLGLGLAIVQFITERHGGKVSVHSEGRGKGAEFSVTFPLIPYEELQNEQLEANLETQGNPDLHGVKVLAVDDSQDILSLINIWLSKAGAQVKTATSAKEGFEVFRSFRPDVVLSDIGMPGEDGYSFIAKVRALSGEEGGGTAAAALTAYARDEERRQALVAGFQMHISKPISSDKLLAAVFRLRNASRDN
jgi:PAS domain S-box-containing protein